MQYDDLDKRIRDAADHHHPTYDEKAWDKMEHLLDKHMPVEKEKKRRFFFFLLLFLLLGGAGWLVSRSLQKKDTVAKNSSVIISNNNTEGKPVNTTTNNNSDVVQSPLNREQGKTNGNEKDPANATAVTSGNETVINKPVVPGNEPITSKSQQMSKPGISYSSAGEKIQKKKPGNLPGEKILTATNNRSPKITEVTVPGVLNKNQTNTSNDISVDVAKNDNTKKDIAVNNDPLSAVLTGNKKDETASQPVMEKQATTETASDKKDKPADSNIVKINKKEKNKKKNYFFAGVSFGGDMSFVEGNKAGATKSIVGVGIGYTINNKFTLRTGFYSGKKVYSAKADSYNPPAAFTQAYPYLQKVDADCKVYEIPVSVSWNFGKGDKNWVVSAGLSSFLMKRETYNYFYKLNGTSSIYSQDWTIKNENAHYFSVATISGGYKRNIGKRVFVMAEPYFKAPLAGVGFGKVKLNSAGVLFTVNVRPFK